MARSKSSFISATAARLRYNARILVARVHLMRGQSRGAITRASVRRARSRGKAGLPRSGIEEKVVQVLRGLHHSGGHNGGASRCGRKFKFLKCVAVRLIFAWYIKMNIFFARRDENLPADISWQPAIFPFRGISLFSVNIENARHADQENLDFADRAHPQEWQLTVLL